MVRFAQQTLINAFGAEKVQQAENIRKAYRKNYPQYSWILVPSYHLGMVTVISAESFDAGQDGIASIIHDNIK